MQSECGHSSYPSNTVLLCVSEECFSLTPAFWEFYNGDLLCGQLLVGFLGMGTDIRKDLCHHPDDRLQNSPHVWRK